MILTRYMCKPLTAAFLLVILLPLPAWAAHSTTLSNAIAPGYFLVKAESLAYPSDAFSIRFEVRDGIRVVWEAKALLRFAGHDSILVQLPAFGPLAEAPSSDLQLLVFVGDVLLEGFDEASLQSYQRMLRYRKIVASSSNDQSLGGTESLVCDSPCGGGCGISEDYDCDGVVNSSDNCTDHFNPDQVDCDGDSHGDVCDVVDGVFQATGEVQTCMTDKDTHLGKYYFDFEHHVEERLVDVSSCQSPDRWDHRIRSETVCYNLGDEFCCEAGLGTSIEQVGDDPDWWCSEQKRNINFCH